MVFHQIAIARHLRCALVSSFFGFIVLAVGIFSPAWLSNLGQNNCTVQEGIWFSRACHSAGGPCIISSREWILQEYGVVRKHPDYERLNWNEFRALTATSIIGGCIVIIILIACICGRDTKCDLPFLFVAAFSALLSCICVLIAVLKISVVEREALSAKPWSRLLATVGSILQFVTTIFVVFAASQRIVRNMASKERQQRLGCHSRNTANQEFIQMGIIPVETRQFFACCTHQDGERLHRSVVGCHVSMSGNTWNSAPGDTLPSSRYLEHLPSYTELDGRSLASR